MLHTPALKGENICKYFNFYDVFMTVTFWLCHSVVLQLDTNIYEEDATSTFKGKACRVKNQFDYVGRLLGRWSLRSQNRITFILKKEAGGFSKTFITIYQIRMRYTPDDGILVATAIRNSNLIIITIYNTGQI
jgi:hypothetical protein